MQHNIRPSSSMQNRLIFIFGLILTVSLSYLVYMLAKIQLVDYREYQQKAVRQQTQPVIVTPARGTIYDANMKPLAVSAAVETITMAPINMDQERADFICKGLSEILEVDYESLMSKMAKKDSLYQVIKKKVEKPEADKVRAFIKSNKIKGVYFFEDNKRYYPYGSLASSVIGFCDADNKGLYGIEATYNDMLSGVPGRIVTARNAQGAEMDFAYEQYFEAKDGNGVVLTIDQTVQQFLEKHLETALIDNGCINRVCGIVMNIKTGGVVAMATVDGYDLNQPREIMDAKTVEDIQKLPEAEREEATLNAMYSQWSNKAVSDMYEPGSTFKIITTAVALEEGVVTETDQFTCPGYKMVGGWRISCWKGGGHGALDFVGGVKGSCNPVFMEVGIRIGSEKFKKYFEALGLKDKTEIDLGGEAKGIFFNKETLDDVDLAVMSFGQRIKVTPIQMIRAVSGIANGGKLMRPHVIKAYTDGDGNVRETVEPQVVRQVISENTSKRVCSILEQVVTNGTGKNAYVAGYRVGGKTGTSEKLDQGDGTGRIASFIGIAPCDDPQYAVLVMLDEPTGYLKQGGQIAAPVCGRIMADILPYLGVAPVYTPEELAKLDVTVQSVIGSPVTEAKVALEKLKLRVRIVGEGETVTDQVPLAGINIPQNSEVILYCGEEKTEEKVTVPLLIGMDYASAMNTLAGKGLYINSTGTIQSAAMGGTVVSVHQSPEQGTEVDRGSQVTVEFIDNNNIGE